MLLALIHMFLKCCMNITTLHITHSFYLSIMFLSVFNYCRRRRYSSDSIVTRRRAGRSGFRIQGVARDSSVFENIQTGSAAHPTWVPGRSGAWTRGQDWSYISTPPMYLLGVDRDDMTFTLQHTLAALYKALTVLSQKYQNPFLSTLVATFQI